MPLVQYKPVTAGLRHRTKIVSVLSQKEPERRLKKILPKHSGRNSYGRVTVRHQGGRQKRYFREIDFKRQKDNVQAKVRSIEYDPNRNANICLLYYEDGDKKYILAPHGLKIGQTVLSGANAPIQIGNNLALKNIPVGTPIHNLELTPGKGGQIVRGAGASAIIQSKEEDKAIVKLPSGEIRTIRSICRATIGQVGNVHHKNISLGKAGRKRLMGIRPSVRGVVMNPSSHPHGGGEGRSGIGMPSPKSPWGKPTLGFKTRKKKKYSNQYILKRRR